MVKPNNEGHSYLIDDALVKIEREQGVNRRTFVKGGVALAAMLAMGGAMGTYAWFTGSEVKENKTSIAENLEIEVVEPNFPESGVVENVVPGAVIPKDPSVVNKSDVLNGYLFTEIRVPIAEVLVEGSEVAERLPLFSFEPNDGWKLLQEFEDGDEKVFRYGWTEVVEHGGQTGSIFDTVTFVNLKDSAQGLDVGEQLVTVIGYGIQDAEAFEGDVAKAWNAYKLQNGITDGVGNKVSAALIAGAAGNKLQFVSGTPSVGDVLDTGEVIEVVEDVEHLPAGDRSPLVSVENIGSVTVVEDVVATKPENTVNWFKDMDSVVDIDISGLDTSEVTDKTGMFDGTVSLESIKIGETTDVADVVPAGFDFAGDSYTRILQSYAAVYKATSSTARVLVLGKGLPDTSYDALPLVNTYYDIEDIMIEPTTTYRDVPWYSHLSYVTKIVIVDRIKPTATRYWFAGSFSLIEVINHTLLDMSACTSSRSMFERCNGIKTLDVSGWNMSNCTDMNSMFMECTALTELNVSGWDVSKCEDFNSMFRRCIKLINLDVGEWDVRNATSFTQMFYYCSLLQLDCSRWPIPDASLDSVSYSGFNQNASGVVAPSWMA